MQNFSHRRALVSAIALAFAVNTALAAEPSVVPARDLGHAEATDLDQIIVTASPLRGTAEALSEPVEILSGEVLNENRAATLGETIGSLPGVQSTNFGPGVGRPVIRGLEGARVAILSGGLGTQDVSTVSQDHAVALEPFLADQIEVLKGPSTLLYGSGAIGGVVNVVDGRIPEAAPASPFSGRAEVRFASVNDGNVDVLRIDAGSERFAFHADAVYRNLLDYETPDGLQPNSFVDTKAGALGGSMIGDWGFLGASVSRYENTYGNPGEPGDAAEGEPGVFLDMRQDRYESKLSVSDPFAGFSQLRASLAHTDYTHTEFEGEEVGTVFDKKATEARAELVHQPLGRWTGAAGLQLLDSAFEAVGEEAFVPRTETRGIGLFVVEQAQWDAAQIDLGARLDSLRSDPEATLSTEARKRRFTPLSLSAGAIWKVAPLWDIVANLDHAERAPAEEELFANGPHIATASFEIGYANLSEEAANQIEFGVHFHGERFQAKAQAYYNRFDDFIFLLDTGEFSEEDALPIRQWSQQDARFRGVEAQASWKIADNSSGSWELSAIADTVTATFADGGGNVPRIAPHRLGLALKWRNEHWTASLGGMRYGEQNKVAENESPTDGYTLVDAHLTYHIDRANLAWEFFADGSNLTNQNARVHTSFLKDVVQLPGRGISAGVRVFF
jgi:iron complex outermembrane recepter protein